MEEKRKSAIADHILKCAEACFLKKGYAETTIRDIAAKAGIAPGTIYIYFKGKKDLFQALNIPEAASLHPQFDRKKDRVLQTALLLFGEKGFHGVTMDDIASKLGISKASLYQYCESKEDLFSQILQTSSFNLFTQSLSSTRKDFDIRDIIKSIGRSYLQIGENPQRSALFKTVIRDSSQFPELGNIYYEQGIKPACTNIVAYIKLHCSQKKRPMKNSRDLYSFVLTYIGSLQSYVLMHDIICGIETDVSREKYLENTTNIFIDYLKTNDYI